MIKIPLEHIAKSSLLEENSIWSFCFDDVNDHIASLLRKFDLLFMVKSILFDAVGPVSRLWCFRGDLLAPGERVDASDNEPRDDLPAVTDTAA